jgi:tetratricopeptide (TPR) repeat protein
MMLRFGPVRRSRATRIVSVLGLRPAFVFALLAALAAPLSLASARGAEQDAVARASQLEQAGKFGEAIELLKRARERRPSSESLAVALGAAYWADHNPFWALNVLGEFVAAHPPACQARAWSAWVHVEQANLDEALSALETPECSDPPELRARFLLLRALVAHHRRRTAEVRALLARARAVDRLYAEDKELLEDLGSRYEPGREPWASWSLELGAGFTTDGLAGAPVDEQSRADAESMLLSLGAHVRAVGTNSGPVRPMLEGQLRAHELTRESVRDYSYRLVSIRPGMLLGRSLPRLELRYAAEAVQLQGGDGYDSGPIWYSEAHRIEYDLQPRASLSVFGGAGYRWIRDRVRTRFELDEGLAWVTGLGSLAHLIVGGSARWYSARASAYTELGATLLAQLDARLLDELTIRVNFSLSGDAYPHSEGYFVSADGRERREFLSRGAVGFWWPLESSLRGALEYAYARRDSTATEYSYQDQRLLLRLQWTDDSDEFAHGVVPRKGRVPLETGSSGRATQARGASVRELLRQDEAAQRSSSCLK